MPLKMLKRILWYDLLNIPKDVIKFIRFCINTDNNKANIMFVSIMYFGGIIITSMLMIQIAILDTTVVLLSYMICIILNLYILSLYKYALYLSKDSQGTFTLILFIFSGPFGMLRIIYLLVCLKIMTTMNEEFYTVLRVRPDRWREVINEETPTAFINSIRKYRKRLRNYS